MNRRRAWSPVVLAAFFAVASTAAPSGAEDAGTFSATASSSGVRVSLTAPGYAAVQELTDFGFPVAQATVDSLGESSGFASYPYPGSTFLAGPGTMAGLIGQGLPSFFAYPFIVSSSYPGQPEGKATQPGYELASTSSDSSSQATAKAGASDQGTALGFSSATAEARRNPTDRTVIAEATNRTEALSLGGALKIGTAAGSAKVTRTTGGELTRESSFTLDGFSVGDQKVGLAPNGLVVPGTTVPAPSADALAQVLAQAGITVRYLRGGDITDGVVSPGMAITWPQQIPNGPLLVMTLTFGQAIARASADAGGTALSDAPAVLEETNTFPAVGGSPTVPAEPVGSDVDLTFSSDPGPLPVSDITGSAPATDLSLATGPAPQSVPAAPMATLSPTARAGTIRFEPTVNSFYSMLVFAALMAVVATLVLRRAEN